MSAGQQGTLEKRIWHLSGVSIGMSHSIALDASSTSNLHQSPGRNYSVLPHRSAHEAQVLRKIIVKKIIKNPPKPNRKVKNRSMIPLSSFSTEQPATDSEGVGHSAVLNSTVQTASRQPKTRKSEELNVPKT